MIFYKMNTIENQL